MFHGVEVTDTTWPSAPKPAIYGSAYSSLPLAKPKLVRIQMAD